MLINDAGACSIRLPENRLRLFEDRMRILQCRAAENAFLNRTPRPQLLVIETHQGTFPMMTTFFSSSTFIALSLILLGALSFAGAVTA